MKRAALIGGAVALVIGSGFLIRFLLDEITGDSMPAGGYLNGDSRDPKQWRGGPIGKRHDDR